MDIKLTYGEYLLKTGKNNCRESWINWKIDCYEMSYDDAMEASKYYSSWKKNK